MSSTTTDLAVSYAVLLLRRAGIPVPSQHDVPVPILAVTGGGDLHRAALGVRVYASCLLRGAAAHRHVLALPRAQVSRHYLFKTIHFHASFSLGISFSLFGAFARGVCC